MFWVQATWWSTLLGERPAKESGYRKITIHVSSSAHLSIWEHGRASVARTPATCLEVWSGDHRQTPGGLKKSKESKSFRKKLTKRPLALRCQTQYTQAHDLGGYCHAISGLPWGFIPLENPTTQWCDNLLVEMAVWAWDDLMHELGTHSPESRRGFLLHNVCFSPGVVF